MTKANYAAWSIKADDFSHEWEDIEKLWFFAKYAVLAPSGHNTQPWRFKATAQILALEADHGRILPYSGIQANEPYVSIGACLGILELAAKGFGYNVSIRYDLQEDAVATVSIAGRTEADPTLLDAITHRVSNRNPYDETPLDNSVLLDITGSNLVNVESYILSSRDDIKYIADLTTESTLTVMHDAKFRAELSKWVRNNLTHQFDGMPGFVQGIPTPVSLLAPVVIKHTDISKDQAKKDSGRVLHSANLVILSITETSHEALINGGRLYAQICVRAQQQGVASTGVGSAIIDPVTTKKVAEKYHITGKPIAIIRLGKASKPARHTPRWPLERVTA